AELDACRYVIITRPGRESYNQAAPHIYYNIEYRGSARQRIPIYRQAVLIYNPVAGKLKEGGAKLIDSLLDTLAQSGHSVSVAPTPGPGTAADLARASIASNADLILAFGGDGTINEVAEGVIGSRTPLGILPGGTANVISWELELGANPVEVAS